MPFLNRVILVLSMIGLLLPAGSAMPPVPATAAYVEPTLRDSLEDGLSVIVTAAAPGQAAAAVTAQNGTVTSDLWLIDAVAALVPADRLDGLAATPGIRSIVMDKSMGTAAELLTTTL